MRQVQFENYILDDIMIKENEAYNIATNEKLNFQEEPISQLNMEDEIKKFRNTNLEYFKKEKKLNYDKKYIMQNIFANINLIKMNRFMAKLDELKEKIIILKPKEAEKKNLKNEFDRTYAIEVGSKIIYEAPKIKSKSSVNEFDEKE